jgi:hypothetical protein
MMQQNGQNAQAAQFAQMQADMFAMQTEIARLRGDAPPPPVIEPETAIEPVAGNEVSEPPVENS